MADLSDLRGMKPFDSSGDASTVSIKWQAWLEEFEAYADSKGLFIEDGKDDNKAQRRALLLYTAGARVRETFKTLENTGEAKAYDEAVAALNGHYVKKVNATYQRHLFRKLSQNEGETVAQFVVRLRQATDGCSYHATDRDNQIRDQVVAQCRSDNLRRKLLEKGDALNLAETLKVAANFEAVEAQFREMKVDNGTHKVNRVTWNDRRQAKDKPKGEDRFKRGKCYRCGQIGHYGRDPSCPAKGKLCSKCGGKDHFASVCKTNQAENRPKADDKSKKYHKPSYKQKGKVNLLECDDSDNRKGYAFNVSSNGTGLKTPIMIGGVEVGVIVDSGSDTNIVSRELWEQLKLKQISCRSRKCSKKLYPYTAKEPLQTIGCFDTVVEAGSQETRAEFLVIEEKGEPLLGRETAEKLGILKIGIGVNHVISTDNIVEKFKNLFTGLGKVKGRQIKLKLNPDIKPVAQPVRRTPFGLRVKVETKIQELIDKDVIEPVEESTPWVSPIVIVPKTGGDIRICMDMRRVNEAIERERHPIPTLDEILQDMSRSNKFSKLDLKWGYHQLELHPDARKVVTFVAHCGLFRYKRLPFGVNAASEIYQHEIHKILQGIPGVANIADDIIVHGMDDEHDERLYQVLDRLEKSGATLNLDKCSFGVTELVWMGHHLTKHGIKPTQEKVKAILNARKPENPTEVRSFLGLVNFVARFIPDLATVADPLRKLTRSDQHFKFGAEASKAFNMLKRRLGAAETLGYFDVNAKTKVIADASPVGLGAILMQEQQGLTRIISYASRSLSAVERRYSQTEKEALGLVWACEKFHPYLYGVKFDLLTDHKPLEVIYSANSKPCARIERWVLRLQPYQFRVIHIAGKKNIADPLSRLLSNTCDDIVKNAELEKSAEEYVRFIALTATPKAVTTREVEEASAEDGELQEIRHCIQSGKWDTCTQRIYAAICNELCIIGKLVLRGPRIIIPRKLRPRILSLAHEGHLGVVGTKQALRTKVWWPGMEKDAEKHCKTCHGCQITSKPNPPEPIRSTKLPCSPWEDLAVDFLGPLSNGQYVLVLIDYYSRYYELELMKSTTAEKTVAALRRIFARHGLPVSLFSDNGPQFISEIFKEYMNECGIIHHRVTPKWPAANGEVERQNQSLEKRMKIAEAEGGDWKSAILTYVAAYRANPHPATGKSPAEMLFGRKIRTKVPELRTDVVDDLEMRDRDAEVKGKWKLYADGRRSAKFSDINLGDKVLMKREHQNKLDSTFYPEPFEVVAKAGSRVTVESPQGAQYQRNTSHVKRYHSPEGSTSGNNLLAKESAFQSRDFEVNPTETDSSGIVIDSETETPSGDLLVSESSNYDSTPVISEQSARPKRAGVMPKKFQDYVMG